MRTETKSEEELIPDLLDVAEFGEFVDPCEMMLRTTELVRFGRAVRPRPRTIRLGEASIGRRPGVFGEGGNEVEEAGVTFDHDGQPVGCSLCHQGANRKERDAGRE